MSGNIYSINSQMFITAHSYSSVVAVEDAEDSPAKQVLAAHIKSGDYFSLLATQLDQVCQGFDGKKDGGDIVLQQIIEDLLFIQQKYKIVKK